MATLLTMAPQGDFKTWCYCYWRCNWIAAKHSKYCLNTIRLVNQVDLQCNLKKKTAKLTIQNHAAAVIEFFNFPLQHLSSSRIQPVWRKNLPGDLCAHHRKTKPPRENLILGPHTHSLTFRPPNFTVTALIEGCFRSDPGRPDAAAKFFQKTSHVRCSRMSW